MVHLCKLGISTQSCEEQGYSKYVESSMHIAYYQQKGEVKQQRLYIS